LIIRNFKEVLPYSYRTPKTTYLIFNTNWHQKIFSSTHRSAVAWNTSSNEQKQASTTEPEEEQLLRSERSKTIDYLLT